MSDSSRDALSVLGLVGSPSPGGQSDTALRALLAAGEAVGVSVTVIELADEHDGEVVQQAMEAADGIVFATPTYRARSSGLMKAVLENTQRGVGADTRAPLRGKATAVLHTGATAHHFLAVDDLRAVLAGFFAAQVLSPGLYFEGADFTESGALTERAAGIAAAHGRAFAEFTAAVRRSPAVTALTPLL